MNSKSKTNIVTATIITALVCVCIAAIMTACGVANNGETEADTEATTDSVLYETEEATLMTPTAAGTKNTTTHTSTSESSTNTTTSTDVIASTTTSEETTGTTSVQATLKTTVKTSAITTSTTATSSVTAPTETSTYDAYLSSTIESTSLYVESSEQVVCTSESTCTTTTTTTTAAAATTTTTVITKPQIKVYYTNQDIVDIAKVLYKECRGVPSKTEQACVAWVILNRVDKNGSTVYSTVRARGQFAFSESTPVWDSLYSLSEDVLERWNREKNGETSVGRVLPKEYIYFEGRNGHNYFRDNYRSPYNVWNYSLASPYEN